jgi:magnesium-transporting ATPase (P-type)
LVHNSKRNEVTLRVPSKDGTLTPTLERHTVLHTLEFTSERKRMSVIVQSTAPDGTVSLGLWCKGADDRVLERLAQGPGMSFVVLQSISLLFSLF